MSDENDDKAPLTPEDRAGLKEMADAIRKKIASGVLPKPITAESVAAENAELEARKKRKR